MSSPRRFLAMALLMALGELCPAATYYVDSVAGNDSANGTSVATPWKSLSKINGTTFLPGDQLLLKAGSSWTGIMHPLGSGNSSAKITLDMYGSGAKPLINGGGVYGGAFYLNNQQYWSINNLELTNNGSTEPKKMGMLIRNDCVGTLSGIEVRNCYIHHVAGDMTGYIDGKESGGIVFYVTISNSNVPSKWTDIVIENNTIQNVDRNGILMQSLWINKPLDPNSNWGGLGPYLPSLNVRIAGNTIENVGGDGIITWCVKGGVVEHNFVRASNNNALGQGHAAVWPYFCEDIIYQYNEVCETKTKFDGMAFDFDNSNQRCIYQYNYSHDNEGGFLNMCCDGNGNDNIVRYNISQNDGCLAGSRVFLVHGDGNHNYQVYNNTVYVKNGNPQMFEQGAPSTGSTIIFKNNIFMNEGTGAFTVPGGCTFDYNLYSGTTYVASDTHRVFANPLLYGPGGGGSGLANVVGYKLRSGSPALSAGTLISSNGGLDYWGNTVSSSTAPHIGAFNGAPLTWIASGNIPLLNPALESGGSGWEDPNSAVAFTSWTRTGKAGASPEAHSALRGLWNCWGYGWGRLAQQSSYQVNFAGETLSATVWIRTSDNLVGNATFELSLTLNGTAAATVQPTYAANQSWTQLTVSYVTTTADVGKTVGISFGTNGGTSNGSPNYVYMDDPALNTVLPAMTSFDSWISSNWPALGDKTANGDPDGDGICNLLEYVLNGNPSVASTAMLPTVNASGSNMVFTLYRLRTSMAATSQLFQYNSELGSVGWTDVSLTQGGMVSITSNTPSAGIDRIIVTVPKGANTRLFGRLSVGN